MVKSVLEPEWWLYQETGKTLTTIKAQSNCWGYWAVKLGHNGKEYTIPKDGLRIHINGWAVYLNWLDITKKVKKWVENIFRHNSWTGQITNLTKE